MTPRTLAELAQLVAGALHGDGSLIVRRALPLALAQPGDITLIDATEKSKKIAANCMATAAVIASGTSEREGLAAGMAVIEVADIHEAFAAIVHSFQPQRARRPGGISPRAHVSPTANIAANVDVHPGATIDDYAEIDSGTVIYPGVYVGPGCKIGRDVQIFPNAVLYENTVIGDRAVIHAGVILGAHGFGYKQVEGRHQLSHQLGNVEIGADVEIGAGSTIDRGTYGPTVIGEGTKIDDQVMIGHNCRIGRHNLICSQVGIAGSCSTGDYVVMAGQVGIRDHLHIADRSVLAAKAGIMYDVDADLTMCGAPAYPIREWKLQQAVLQKLPDLRHEIKQIERTLAEMRAQLDSQTAETKSSDSRQAA